MQDNDNDKDTSRRSFLGTATLAIGGVMGAVTALPIVRYFLHPVGRKVVSTPNELIDIAAEADLLPGAAPVRLPIIANGVKDAWNVANNVAVGSCWVQKDSSGAISAFSSVCPHLGCSVSFVESSDDFRCPCHNSAFEKTGEKKDKGPAKRGLDPLEVKVVDGRVKIRYQRFRNDISEREPV